MAADLAAMESGSDGKGKGGRRVAKSLHSRTIHCQLTGTSARALVAHGKGSERGWCGPANLGEAGAGRQRKARLARAGRS